MSGMAKFVIINHHPDLGHMGAVVIGDLTLEEHQSYAAGLDASQPQGGRWVVHHLGEEVES